MILNPFLIQFFSRSSAVELSKTGREHKHDKPIKMLMRTAQTEVEGRLLITLDLISGSPLSSLSEPYTIVVGMDNARYTKQIAKILTIVTLKVL